MAKTSTDLRLLSDKLVNRKIHVQNHTQKATAVSTDFVENYCHNICRFFLVQSQ